MKTYWLILIGIWMISCGNRQVQQAATVTNDTSVIASENHYFAADYEVNDEETSIKPMSGHLLWLTPEKNLPNTPLMQGLVDLYNGSLMLNSIWSDFELWFRFDTSVKDEIRQVNSAVISDPRIKELAQTYKDLIMGVLHHDTIQTDSIVFNRAKKAYKHFKAALANRYNINHYGKLSEHQYWASYDKNNVIPNYDSIYNLRGTEDQLHANQLKQKANNEIDFNKKCIYTLEFGHANDSEPTEEIVKPLVGLMQSKQYSLYLIEIWRTWRCLTQTLYGASKDSKIPNNAYNQLRMVCANTILQHIVSNPDDIMAINQFLTLSFTDNIYRYGAYPSGNQNILEAIDIFPEKYQD